MADSRQRSWGMEPAARSAEPSSPPPPVGVVLAAGRSERLAKVTGGTSKALLRVGGTTLVERAVRSLRDGGVTVVVVVVGHDADAVSAAVGGLPGVRVVRSEHWELGNGASLAAAEPAVGAAPLFAVTCADHVFAEGSLHELLGAGEPAVLVDPDPVSTAWDEGTRVRVEGGRAFGFGKQLVEPGIDCGAFVLDRTVFDGYRTAAAEGDHSLAGAISRVATARPVRAVTLEAPRWWQDVDTPQDLVAARNLVRRSLGKDTDGPVSRHLNRPISTRLTMALAPVRVPPGMLSVLVLLTGLWAAWSLSASRAVVGGLLVQATSVLDGTDGETARLRRRVSTRGAWLDTVFDRMVDAAIVAGLSLWQWNNPSKGFRVLIIGMSMAGWALIALTAKRTWPAIPALERPAPAERRLGLLLGGRDGRLLLIAVFALAARPELALATAALAWGSTVLIRFVLLLARPVWRPEPAAPRQVGEAAQGDL